MRARTRLPSPVDGRADARAVRSEHSVCQQMSAKRVPSELPRPAGPNVEINIDFQTRERYPVDRVRRGMAERGGFEPPARLFRGTRAAA